MSSFGIYQRNIHFQNRRRRRFNSHNSTWVLINLILELCVENFHSNRIGLVKVRWVLHSIDCELNQIPLAIPTRKCIV